MWRPPRSNGLKDYILNNMKPTQSKAFINSKHNGIKLTFPNGNCISTIWGIGTYSENYDYKANSTYEDFTEGYRTFMGSDTCEIMILNCPDKLYKKIHRKFGSVDNSVIGYVSMKDWLEIIKLLSK